MREGVTCMDYSELQRYFTGKSAFVMTSLTYIDYEDIQEPVKAIYKGHKRVSFN